MLDDIRLLSVSSNASNNLADGHYKAVYESLINFSESNFEYLGTVSSNAASEIGVYKLLSREAKFSSFGPFLRSQVRRDCLSVRDFIQQRNLDPNVIQIYEGGLRELLLAIQLADIFPKTMILYNFFFGKDWLNFAMSNASIAAKLKPAITQRKNLVLSADTTPLAEFISRWLDLQIATYPVFSSLSVRSQRKSATGLLITLTDLGYSDLCLRLIHQLGATIPTSIIIPHWLPAKLSEKFVERACGMGSKIYHSSLDVETYSKLLIESRVHLLLHSPEKYMYQSSGRFEDSLLTSSLTLAPASLAFLAEQGRPELQNCSFDDQAEDRGLSEILSRLFEMKGRPMPPGRSVRDLVKWLRKLHEKQAIHFTGDSINKTYPLDNRELSTTIFRALSVKKFILYVLLFIGLPKSTVAMLSQLPRRATKKNP